MCVCVCVYVCVRACVCACVRVCVCDPEHTGSQCVVPRQSQYDFADVSWTRHASTRSTGDATDVGQGRDARARLTQADVKARDVIT